MRSFLDVSRTLFQNIMKKHCGNILGLLKNFPENVLGMCSKTLRKRSGDIRIILCECFNISGKTLWGSS